MYPATADQGGVRNSREPKMFKLDQLKQTALAAVAAILFSATMIGAAVGPAQVAEVQTAAARA
jgi:hypothetical protein